MWCWRTEVWSPFCSILIKLSTCLRSFNQNFFYRCNRTRKTDDFLLIWNVVKVIIVLLNSLKGNSGGNMQQRVMWLKRIRKDLSRKYVAAEKETLEGAPNTMITVERTRLVEDGYRQLSVLSSNALKATIRVKFINQQVSFFYNHCCLFDTGFFQSPCCLRFAPCYAVLQMSFAITTCYSCSLSFREFQHWKSLKVELQSLLGKVNQKMFFAIHVYPSTPKDVDLTVEKAISFCCSCFVYFHRWDFKRANILWRTYADDAANRNTKELFSLFYFVVNYKSAMLNEQSAKAHAMQLHWCVFLSSKKYWPTFFLRWHRFLFKVVSSSGPAVF